MNQRNFFVGARQSSFLQINLFAPGIMQTKLPFLSPSKTSVLKNLFDRNPGNGSQVNGT